MSGDDENGDAVSPQGRTYLICKICGDRAVGRHFGVPVCDGCKGFFRRSVRNSQVYACRFTRDCVIDKHKRNQCRYCRLRKCFWAGMKKESVQLERDQIIRGRRPIPFEISNRDTTHTITLGMLQEADTIVKSKTVCAPPPPIPGGDDTSREAATVNDFYGSVKEQLLSLVEWTKHIPAFIELPLEDRVALLRAQATNNLLLGLVRRSIHMKDTLLVGNGFIIKRSDKDVIGVVERIMDELVQPLRRLNMNDTEFASLKTIIFFDPTSPGLKNPEKILKLRDQAQLILEDYIMDRGIDTRGRFGSILLTLPSFRAISVRLTEEMHFRKLFGIAHIDRLLQEMILGIEFADIEMGGRDESEISEEQSEAAMSQSDPSIESTMSIADGESEISAEATSPLLGQLTDEFSQEYNAILSVLNP